MSVTGTITPASITSAAAIAACGERARIVSMMPAAGEPAEHGERRDHEQEMPDAVIHGRARDDRDRERQQRGEHDEDEGGAAADRNFAPEARR